MEVRRSIKKLTVARDDGDFSQNGSVKTVLSNWTNIYWVSYPWQYQLLSGYCVPAVAEAAGCLHNIHAPFLYYENPNLVYDAKIRN